MKNEKESIEKTVRFEYSGSMSENAINEANEIAKKSISANEAWNLAQDSEYYNSILENGGFIEDSKEMKTIHEKIAAMKAIAESLEEILTYLDLKVKAVKNGTEDADKVALLVISFDMLLK